MHKALEMRLWRSTERLLLIVGALLIAIYVAAYIHRTILSHAELRRFQDAQTQQKVRMPVGFRPGSQVGFDFSLWSEKRIAAYEQTLSEHIDPPLAVLRISKIHLEVPVLEGTDDLILNRGVGHIAGTVPPGKDGNIGIAGHRDGFFRVLKDIGPGAAVELATPTRTDTYIVDRIVIVRPDDVSVLQPRSVSSLTLVTCYPFYYVGSAPERYIVQASKVGRDWPARQADTVLEQTATAGQR
jgi:sortase A